MEPTPLCDYCLAYSVTVILPIVCCLRLLANLEIETSASLVEYAQLLNLPAVPATQAYS